MNLAHRPALLVLHYKLLIFARWVRSHAFTLFVLGPMIVGGFYLVLEPSLVRAADWLREQSRAWSAQDLDALSLGLAMILVAVWLSSTLRATYSLSSADVYLDALPIRPLTRFHMLALSQGVKKLPACIVLLFLFHLLGSKASVGNAAWLLIALVELALLEIVAVLVLVHYHSFRAGRLMLLASAFCGLLVASRNEPLLLLAIVPLLPSAALLREPLLEALPVSAAESGLFSEGWMQIVALTILYVGAALLFVRWRDRDREFARESAERQRSLAFEGFAFFSQRLRGDIVAQILRDWRLTRRVFSPAVYAAAAFAVLFLLLPVFVFGRWNLEPARFAQGVQACCAFSVLSLASLAPLLLRYELSFFWVERSAGVDPETIWRAKVWYACLLASPAIVVAALSGTLGASLDMAGAAVFIGKLALISWTVASLIGAAAFEVVESPLLGMLLSGLFAMGLAGMYIFTDLWPIWAFIHIYLMHHLYERADGHSDTLGVEEL